VVPGATSKITMPGIEGRHHRHRHRRACGPERQSGRGQPPDCQACPVKGGNGGEPGTFEDLPPTVCATDLSLRLSSAALRVGVDLHLADIEAEPATQRLSHRCRQLRTRLSLGPCPQRHPLRVRPHRRAMPPGSRRMSVRIGPFSRAGESTPHHTPQVAHQPFATASRSRHRRRAGVRDSRGHQYSRVAPGPARCSP
jgi:hypothetical protein